jgi:hypothetical protein
MQSILDGAYDRDQSPAIFRHVVIFVALQTVLDHIRQESPFHAISFLMTEIILVRCQSHEPKAFTLIG